MNALQSNLLLTIALLLGSLTASAQDFTQTVRGQIIDRDTKVSLPGANVVIIGSDPLIGTTSDMDGYFRMENVPVGRISIEVTYLGYAPITMSNLSLGTGKELVLTIELEEQVITTKEVVITATQNKAEVLNEMASVSARTFSVEESQRFAGARNDVSRMAANFAGVNTANDAVNDIVIRGNSPTGLLWRYEGVDIPNPNHFGEGNNTGGPVSILNNNVLSNSDFFTGAFPSEYGNALSGVFDLRMRNGNNEKHEFVGQVGFNGFEFGAEGPLAKNSRGSYLVNYRYSTVGFMKTIGIDVGTGAAVPDFQDLSFKINLPTKNAGRFSLFGIGGMSSIEFLESTRDTTEDDGENFYAGADQDIYSRTRMGVIGLTHTYLFNNTTYSKITLSATGHVNENIVDSISTEDQTLLDYYGQEFVQRNYAAHILVNKKLNKRNNIRVGGFIKNLDFNLLDSVYVAGFDRFETLTDINGTTQLYQPYVMWKFKVNDELTFNTGVHYQYLALNGSDNIEPRLGLQWKVAPNQTISAAFGVHSQMAPINLYYSQTTLADGSVVLPNTDLDFTRSNHYVLGYDWNFSETKRLKVEAYYQQVYDAIIEASPSSYSLLNRSSFGAAPPDSLVNGGTGTNYGVELTLEQFMNKGFYYLTTLSLFESTYEGSDGIERNTAFNGNYVFNILGGKEFNLGQDNPNARFKKTLSIDGKVTMAGGARYTPVDIVESQIAGTTVYQDDVAFSEQFTDYFRADLRIGFKMLGKKADQEWALDIQNITNQENPLFQVVNVEQGTVQTANQLGLFPMLQYRVTF